jgi:hypothetical protein
MRKAVAFESVVIAIVVLASFVALAFLASKFITLSSTAVIDRICQTSALANAYGRAPVVGTELFNLNCPRKLTTLKFLGEGKGVEVDIKAKLGNQEKDFTDKYTSYTKAKDSIKKYGFKETNEDMFVINNAIADQVMQCWSNMGGGDLTLFSNWWSYFKFENAPAESGWLKKIGSYIPGYNGPPVNCVICSRIVLDDKTQKYFQDKKISQVDSLGEWFNKNPVPGMNPPISYAEALSDNAYIGLFQGANFNYNVDKPMAVVFTRINVMKGTQLFTWVATVFPGYSEEDRPKDIDAIYIWPYEELGKRCTILYN